MELYSSLYYFAVSGFSLGTSFIALAVRDLTRSVSTRSKLQHGQIRILNNPFHQLPGQRAAGSAVYTNSGVIGRLVEIIVNNEIDVNNEKEVLEINSSKFDKGVYFLCLKSPFNFNKTIKFVVNR